MTSGHSLPRSVRSTNKPLSARSRRSFAPSKSISNPAPREGKHMPIEHFNVGRPRPVALDLGNSDIRLRLLELDDWARLTQTGFTQLVDSADQTHLLAPDDVRHRVVAVRAR